MRDRIAIGLVLLVLAAGPAGAAGAVSKEDAALFLAAERGQVELIRDLLRRGAHLEAITESKYTPLMVAASRGQAAAVAELLKAGANPNAAAAGTGGWSVLEVAVIQGKSLQVIEAVVAAGADARRIQDGGARLLAESSSQPEIVRALLAAGAQTPVFRDRTILENAARSGNKDLLDALLRRFEHDDFPGSPLEIALRGRDLSLVQALLRDGVPVNGRTRSNGTPLIAAVNTFSLEAIRMLLAAGAAVDLEDQAHQTPLVWAVRYEKPEIVELLLSKGAKVNYVPVRPGTTALGEAISERHLEMVRLLLRHGADPNLPDANGFTPLQKAASGERGEIVALLLAHGAREDAAPAVGQVGPPGKDAITLATEACDGPGMVALLKAGASPDRISPRLLGHCLPKTIWEVSQAGVDLNRRDPKGETALLSAVTRHRPETVVRLLELGADANLAAPDGETALMRAASDADRWEEVQALLDHHADPKAVDSRGRTALHRAAEIAAWRSLSLLAQAGADPDLRDRDGRTPRELYLRKRLSSGGSPRIAGAGLTRISFVLPPDFNPYKAPARQPAFPILAEYTSVARRGAMWVSISWAPRGATVTSVEPGEEVTVVPASWEGRPLSIGRYAAPYLEQVPNPEVWIAVVPVPSRPLLVRVWAPREYGMEAGWVLRGILQTLRQPPPIDQFLALGAGRIATMLGCSVGLLALLAAAAVWLFRKLFTRGKQRGLKR